MASRRASTASVARNGATPPDGRRGETASLRGHKAKTGVVKAHQKKAAAATKRYSGSARGAKQGAAAKRGNGAVMPERLMRIRELDPQAACGRGTTVLQLFRVDDLPSDSATTHLVFFDRHGWYCEHGRECPAVAAVQRHEKRQTLTR
jgi:hypothetical protein